jgi:hypothetical protein
LRIYRFDNWTIADWTTATVLARKEVGKNWIYRFQKRHRDIKSAWAQTMESAWAQQLNPAVVQDFYNKLITELVDGHIPVQNIFNANEKGIQCGEAEHVLPNRQLSNY